MQSLQFKVALLHEGNEVKDNSITHISTKVYNICQLIHFSLYLLLCFLIADNALSIALFMQQYRNGLIFKDFTN